MPTPSRAVAAFVLLLAAVAAQDDASPRIVHPGRVLDRAGEPVGGAEVTFVTADASDGALAQDVVRVTSAENGRFRAELLPTRQYRAWAVAAAGALAEFAAVSNAVELELPMTVIRFGSPKAAKEQLQLAGLAPWRAIGEVRAEVLVSDATGFVAPRVMTDEDALPLPPLPRNDVMLELRVFVDGAFVHSQRVYMGGTVQMPQPRRVLAKVVDEAGAPVADATIDRIVSEWGHSQGPFPTAPDTRRFRVATTDADGAAEWWVAADEDPFVERGYTPLPFVVSKPGYREGVAGFTEVVFAEDEILDVDAEARTLPFKLVKAEALRCVVRGARADVRLQVTGQHSLLTGKNSYRTCGELADHAIGAGELVLPPSARGLDDRRVRLTGVVPVLAEDDPFRRLAVSRPVWLAGERFAGAFEFDVGEVVPLRIRLLDQTGGPAMGAYVACLSIDVDEDDPYAVPMRTDAGGRLVLPVLPGRWFVLALRDGNWCKAELDVVTDNPVVELKLEPMPVMKLRVVDGEGNPVAGAQPHSGSASWSSGGGPVMTILTDFGSSIASWSMRDRRSDADGHLDVPCAPTPLLRMKCHVQRDGKQSGRFALEPSDERVDVVLK